MNKRVLIIDDDMDLCLLLGKLLTKNGYETEPAYTGNKGITRFSEKKFDAVICDYRLGDMEGKHVLTELKKGRSFSNCPDHYRLFRYQNCGRTYQTWGFRLHYQAPDSR